MSFYFSNFTLSNITNDPIYSIISTDANYYKTNIYFAGYTVTGNTGLEKMYQLYDLGNFISNYNTVANTLNADILVTSINAPQNSFTFSTSTYTNVNNLPINRIDKSPSSARAWVNFDGYLGTSDSTVYSSFNNFQQYNYSYSSSTGYLTITIPSGEYVQSQKVYINPYNNNNIPSGIYAIAVFVNATTVKVLIGFITLAVNGIVNMKPWPVQGSYNVSSISYTAGAAHYYGINFINPITDINYSCFGNGMNTNGLMVNVYSTNSQFLAGTNAAKSPKTVLIQAVAAGTTNNYDYAELSLIVLGKDW
jgi:hypothetical protein